MNKKSSRRVTLNARSPIRKRLLCSFSKLHKRFNNLVQKFVRKVFLQKNDSFLFRRNIKGGIFGQSCSIFLLKMIFAQLGNVAATLRRSSRFEMDTLALKNFSPFLYTQVADEVILPLAGIEPPALKREPWWWWDSRISDKKTFFAVQVNWQNPAPF